MSEKRLISSSVLFAAIEEELQNHHQASFTITGMSMWPFLCHGRDKVIITACAAADLKKGDIVLLQTPLGNYLLHRVTGRKTGMIETTGDGTCVRDHLSNNTSLRGEGCIFQALCLLIVFSAYNDHDDHSRCGDDHDAGDESGLYSCGSIGRCCVT